MRTIGELFRARAARTPDAPALIFESDRVTYAALAARTNAVASALGGRGIEEEDVVAVAMRHSPELVAVLLGVAEAGAAHVGVDPGWPLPRVHDVLDDSRPALLVADDNEVARSARFDGEILVLPRDLPDPSGRGEEPRGAGRADGLFSVVYTSGTTGRPKGVLVTVGSVMNRLEWMWNTYPFQAGDVGFLHRPYTMVGFSWDCFGPLLQGVPTVISSLADGRDVIATVKAASGAGVTHVSAAVAFWEVVLDLAERQPNLWPSLRLARTSGEPLRPSVVERWRRVLPQARLLNIYGATECSGSTAYDTSELDPACATRVPVGTPVPGVEVLVVDATMSPVAAGQEGEICIAGIPLARGYLGDPMLTAERFLPCSGGSGAHGRVFRTGDLGFRRADGRLEITGRRDLQVKVRGYRVEVEEVEAALARCAGVRAAAVHGRRDGGSTRLVGFVVTEGRVTASDLRDALALMLPDYMIPAEFAAVSELPRTPAGKIDRRSLEELEGAELEPGTAYTAPRTPSEVTISAVWADVLGMSDIGADDDFFEIGGHSLSGVRIVARLQDAFGIDVPLRTLFDNPSVRTLAAAIDRLQAGAATPPSRPAAIGRV